MVQILFQLIAKNGSETTFRARTNSQSAYCKGQENILGRIEDELRPLLADFENNFASKLGT
jgi:hypothetical protein